MVSIKLKSFCSLLTMFFANILHNNTSQDNIVMKIVSLRQIFDNCSEPGNFQDIATYFTVGCQEVKEDIHISVHCCSISKKTYYVRSRSFLIQLHSSIFFFCSCLHSTCLLYENVSNRVLEDYLEFECFLAQVCLEVIHSHLRYYVNKQKTGKKEKSTKHCSSCN